MAILKKEKQEKGGIEIDLTGPQGNAYFLMGTASNLAKQLGLDGTKIISEMKSGDYENLLQVFEKYFGEYVTLYR
tara:strand:- start:675 stop:899 length:225 start_codon:yes stop_codon:yes gene_type:complete